MTVFVDAQNISEVPVAVWMAPAEKARAIPFLFTMPAPDGTNYEINLGQLFQSGRLTTFQTVYIDNAKNGSSTSVSVDQTGQVITAAPFSQGYYTVAAPMPCRVSVSSAGNAAVGIQLINVMIPENVWSTASAGTTVSDPVLEAGMTLSTPTAKSPSAMQAAGVHVTTAPILSNGESNPFLLDGSGNLLISGTVAIAGTVTVSNITNPVTVSSIGAPVAISGTVSTADAIIDAAVRVAGPGASAASEIQIGGVFNSAGIALTNGQGAALQMSSTGQLFTADTTLPKVLKAIGASAAPADALEVAGVFTASTGIALTSGQGAALQQAVNGSLQVMAGYGSGDIIRPNFTCFQAQAASLGVTPAGANIVILGPVAAGVFISSITLSTALAATSPGSMTITIADGVTPISAVSVNLGNAAVSVTVTNISLPLENYLSPLSGTSIHLIYGAVPGLVGGMSVSINFATTALIGP